MDSDGSTAAALGVAALGGGAAALGAALGGGAAVPGGPAASAGTSRGAVEPRDGGPLGGAGPCGAGCARTGALRGWKASATRQISRNSTRTREPHAIPMGSVFGTAPLVRRELDVGHDFPLVQMSGNIVIESEAHQYHQQGNPDLLTEILGALGQRAPLDGFHQLINHLPAVQ